MSNWVYSQSCSAHVARIDNEHEFHVWKSGCGEFFMAVYSHTLGYYGEEDSFPTLLAAKSIAERDLASGAWEDYAPSCGKN